MRQFTGCAQHTVWLHKWSPSSLSSFPTHLPASPGALVPSCCLSAQDIHYFPFVDEKTGLGECLLIFSQIPGDILPSWPERLPRGTERTQNIKTLSLLALSGIKQWQMSKVGGPGHLFLLCRTCGNCLSSLLFSHYRNIRQWLICGSLDGNKFHQVYKFALWRLQR